MGARQNAQNFTATGVYTDVGTDSIHHVDGFGLAQFPSDIQGGDTASAAADLQTLLRVAHSLKSVLLTLGHPQHGALARTLEETCRAGVLAPAQMQWEALRAHLGRLGRGN